MDQCNGMMAQWQDGTIWNNGTIWHDGTMLRWWTKVVGEVAVVGCLLSGLFVA